MISYLFNTLSLDLWKKDSLPPAEDEKKLKNHILPKSKHTFLRKCGRGHNAFNEFQMKVKQTEMAKKTGINPITRLCKGNNLVVLTLQISLKTSVSMDGNRYEALKLGKLMFY